jgi:hypothetical protein
MLKLAQWAVSDVLAENELRSGFFSGAENPRRRTQNIVEFHDDPQFRILFATDAGGVGLNLQRAANCVINIELPWNPAVLEQRIGRIYRLGQQNPIDVYNLVSEQGIEARIAALVGTKQALFKGLFDGESDSVQFGEASGFMAKIQKLYEPATLDAIAATDNQPEADADRGEFAGDDTLPDAFDELIEAGDESEDVIVPTIEEPVSVHVPAVRDDSQFPAHSSTEIAAQSPSPAQTTSTVRNVLDLFSQAKIRREASGKVLIEATPEAATAIAAIFEGMAALFDSAAKSGE